MIYGFSDLRFTISICRQPLKIGRGGVTIRKLGTPFGFSLSVSFQRVILFAQLLVEWTGFAILTASPAAWVFVWWTFANLVPRSDAIYRHYRAELIGAGADEPHFHFTGITVLQNLLGKL